MKILPCKVVQEKDELGNLISVNYPIEPIPSNAVKVVCDGQNYQVAMEDVDVQKIRTDYPSVKELDDSAVIGTKDPVDPKDPTIIIIVNP